MDGKLYKDSGRIQPFMEVNWLHASDNASATFGDTKVSQDLPNDRVEVKVGIQANVSERLLPTPVPPVRRERTTTATPALA